MRRCVLKTWRARTGVSKLSVSVLLNLFYVPSVISFLFLDPVLILCLCPLTRFCLCFWYPKASQIDFLIRPPTSKWFQCIAMNFLFYFYAKSVHQLYPLKLCTRMHTPHWHDFRNSYNKVMIINLVIRTPEFSDFRRIWWYCPCLLGIALPGFPIWWKSPKDDATF